MKIRALQLTNVRRFAGRTARIEGIGDGITVLCEPNEFGKSTFFDVIHALFFERHRATRAAVKALQPHAGGAPEVAADLDMPDGRYRIETDPTIPQFGEPNIHVGYDDGEVFIRRVVDLDDERAVVNLTLARRD